MISSQWQTKDWRQKQNWYKNGKSNECEIYQLQCIRNISKQQIKKTFFRINLKTLELIENKYPMKHINGFDWTENFDGYQMINENHIFYNLKFVCDQGGHQTRTLRETYHFIESQLKYLKNNVSTNIYFINILEGNTCFSFNDKFQYILSLYKSYTKNVFVGDMKEFSVYFTNHFYPL